jgi:hypothetical protein
VLLALAALAGLATATPGSLAPVQCVPRSAFPGREVVGEADAMERQVLRAQRSLVGQPSAPVSCLHTVAGSTMPRNMRSFFDPGLRCSVMPPYAPGVCVTADSPRCRLSTGQLTTPTAPTASLPSSLQPSFVAYEAPRHGWDGATHPAIPARTVPPKDVTSDALAFGASHASAKSSTDKT